MTNEHNRYREEENEVAEEIQEESSQENSASQEIPSEEVKEKTKKTKKQKKIEDFDEYHDMVLEIAKLKDDLLRNRAELENFKRRSNEERIRERKYCLQSFLEDLIDVIDIYDKVVNIKTDDEKLSKFLVGFVMLNNQLKQILERYEVRKIEALNQPFDPAFHEAMETVKIEGVEPNIVVEVSMNGYVYKDRVLRPSKVKVSE